MSAVHGRRAVASDQTPLSDEPTLLRGLAFTVLDGLYKTRNFVLRKGTHFSTRGKPAPHIVAFKEAFSSKNPPDVLLFGDSVHQRVARQDQDRRTLAVMTAELLAVSGRRPYVLAHSSYTAVMYEPFIAFAARLGRPPAEIVMPINLRVLSPQWEAYSIWQFAQDRAVIEAQILDPDAPVPAVAPVIEDLVAYHNTAFASPLSRRRSVGEFKALAGHKPNDPARADERLRELLVFHYGMPARRSHRQIAAVRAAVRTASELGINLHAYLTPINMPLIRKLGGAALERIVGENAALMRDAVLGSGDPTLTSFNDWLDALPPSGLFHANELTEHLCEEGRRALSELIVAAVDAAARPQPRRLAT